MLALRYTWADLDPPPEEVPSGRMTLRTHGVPSRINPRRTNHTLAARPGSAPSLPG
ncbi:hypothetical protein AB1K54_03355 [Microbacterium sp. BWT-B31]|uniref:hypothetical protein n=1 Tax=Microbacterium sp. BWT-B31 TaxID=3232072 RepID=UPI0035279A5F